ncbi:MAG: replication initiator [Oryzihumus sp.]
MDPELVLPDLSPRVEAEVVARMVSKDRHEWADQAARTGHCSRPVRLRGRTLAVDTRTGEVRTTYASDWEESGIAFIRCGNRREAVCVACAREYASDTWHLIRAGAAGGDKGVPSSVSEHPMVFATVTAPSFGLVHSAKKPGTVGSSRCRPRRTKTLCPHGRPTWCMATHAPDDPIAGQPLCEECYDYHSHVVWQYHAPELWHRLRTALGRHLARRLGITATRLDEVLSIQFAKVAEYQLRGIIHFHALIRLDGPKDAGPFAPPPVQVSARVLAEAFRTAAAAATYTAAPAGDDDTTRILGFGQQVDARPVSRTAREGLDTEELSPEQVAGYIAKYASKSADDISPTTRDTAHVSRIKETVARLAYACGTSTTLRDWPEDNKGRRPYETLGKWEHMLGFPGHFATKSRRYSTTRAAIRSERRRFQIAKSNKEHTQRVLDLTGQDTCAQAEEETTLVVGQWEYVGMGWLTDGDAALATAAAVWTREHRREQAAARRSNRAGTR